METLNCPRQHGAQHAQRRLLCCRLCPSSLSLLLFSALKVSRFAAHLRQLLPGRSSPALCSSKPSFPKAIRPAGSWRSARVPPGFPGGPFWLSKCWVRMPGLPGLSWEWVRLCLEMVCDRGYHIWSGKHFAQGLFPIEMSY